MPFFLESVSIWLLLLFSFTIVVLIGIWLKLKRSETSAVKGVGLVRGSKNREENESVSSSIGLSGVLFCASSYREVSDSVSEFGGRKVLPCRDVVCMITLFNKLAISVVVTVDLVGIGDHTSPRCPVDSVGIGDHTSPRCP